MASGVGTAVPTRRRGGDCRDGHQSHGGGTDRPAAYEPGLTPAGDPAARCGGGSFRMKTRFVFNPYSGRNRKRPRFAAAIRDFITSSRLDADLVVTEGPGHATALAAEAVQGGCHVVVAVGGDGTMNEV